jgi:hypothetical protein
VLDRITKVPVTTVMRENTGHLPLEDPGLQQLEDSIAANGHARAEAGLKNNPETTAIGDKRGRSNLPRETSRRPKAGPWN